MTTQIGEKRNKYKEGGINKQVLFGCVFMAGFCCIARPLVCSLLQLQEDQPGHSGAINPPL